MAEVLIVTDSTADLPAAMVQKLGVTVVPLNVHFGDDVFQDGVTLNSDGFWAQLDRSPNHPKTSQPAPGDFLTVYQQAVAAGRPVVSIHVSGKLSGTLQSARIAREMLQGGEVHLVDTGNVSLGLGIVVAHAAAVAARGADATEVARQAQQLSVQVRILFGVDTLDFLQRGGRIGKAQAFLGGLLGFKPLLKLEDGQVGPADRVRGKSKVLPRILELMADRVPAGHKICLGLLHAQAEADAQAWSESMRRRYQVAEQVTGVIGPVVGAHAGPGAVGVVFYETD